ncbi:lysophospholipid acyltransferase family protein [Geotalea toluenoxydans]|uniref:lysophospholipid acyltransferase family protein n=1 Tax=Geotalea toluenoxydans TaxID=421624 RepID=UPI0006D0F375|nr:lysophospholipid acyltransferase family protein [Geotalea toluenoxydans]
MVYRLLRLVFSLYLRSFHLLRIKGMHHIPLNGPLILCANHSSYFDSMLLALCTTRQIHFLIYQSFYHHPLLGWFVRKCGAIAVTQNGNDKEALGRSLAILRQGGVIGVFPEGRLSATGIPNEAKSGAALLAVASGAPIIPVTISGAHAVFAKGRKGPSPGTIMVEVHAPVHPDRSKRKDKAYLRALIDWVMGRIERRLVAHRRRRAYFARKRLSERKG